VVKGLCSVKVRPPDEGMQSKPVSGSCRVVCLRQIEPKFSCQRPTDGAVEPVARQRLVGTDTTALIERVKWMTLS
jgi:hypothetical protein